MEPIEQFSLFLFLANAKNHNRYNCKHSTQAQYSLSAKHTHTAMSNQQERIVTPVGPLSDEDKERIAQEAYGQPYAELTSNERKSVGGIKGGAASAGHTADPEHAPGPPAVQFGEDNPAPGDRR